MFGHLKLTGIVVIEKQYLQGKPHLNRIKPGVELWIIKEIQDSHHLTLRRHNDVIRDEIRVIAPHMLNQKTTILILCSFVFSPLRILSLFSRLSTPNV